jgi:hypothetical protein
MGRSGGGESAMSPETLLEIINFLDCPKRLDRSDFPDEITFSAAKKLNSRDKKDLRKLLWAFCALKATSGDPEDHDIYSAWILQGGRLARKPSSDYYDGSISIIDDHPRLRIVESEGLAYGVMCRILSMALFQHAAARSRLLIYQIRSLVGRGVWRRWFEELFQIHQAKEESQ